MGLKKQINSFRFAFQGIADLLRTQANSRFHLLAAVAVIAAGFWLHVSAGEWLALIICITLVISLEALNTALEYLTDLVSPDYHPLAGKAKDAAAGAVLLAAFGSLAVGLLVFLPKIAALFF